MFKWHNSVYIGRNLPPQHANRAPAQIGVTEYHTWKQFVLQSEQAKKIVARVKAEEKESKPRPEKSTQRTLEQSFQPKRKDTLAMETTSSVKPQPPRGGNTSGQTRVNKQYSFKDEHIVSLFKLLHKSNKPKLPKEKRPQEAGKTDNSNYYLYYRMVRHPTKSYYIFKDILQALIDVDVLKLRPEQKKVTANMTSLQFDKDLLLAPTRVVPIPKWELRMTNTDPHNKEKGLVPVSAPRGEIMWVHPDMIESQQWTTMTNGKSRGKTKASSCNVVSVSPREIEECIASQ